MHKMDIATKTKIQEAIKDAEVALYEAVQKLEKVVDFLVDIAEMAEVDDEIAGKMCNLETLMYQIQETLEEV